MIDEKLAQLLEVMPDSVLVMVADGAIAFANSRTENLLGYAPDELLGQPLETIVPQRFWERYVECSAAHFAESLRRPMPGGLSFWALCKHGREVPVDISLNSIETDQGFLVVASMRNATCWQKTESELRSALADAERLRDRLEKENLYFRDEIRRAGGYEEFIGKSAALMELLERIDQVAKSDANVLILGETGTGKELVARAIHVHSDRKDHPLVKMNCAPRVGYALLTSRPRVDRHFDLLRRAIDRWRCRIDRR